MGKYLDNNGLSHLLLKLKTTIPEWIKDTFALKSELPTDTEKAAWNNKVDKVEGKELSTNDLTNTLKSNYDAAYSHSTSSHAPSDAEKNVIVGITVNGSEVSPDSTRKVNMTVPTKVSELTNDKSYATTSQLPTKTSQLTNDSSYATTSEVTSAIAAEVGKITGFEFVICGTGGYDTTTGFPTGTGSKGKVYLVPKTNSEEDNVYSEFIWVNNAYEKIGDTSVDLSDYMKTTDMQSLTNDEIDTIVAAS